MEIILLNHDFFESIRTMKSFAWFAAAWSPSTGFPQRQRVPQKVWILRFS